MRILISLEDRQGRIVAAEQVKLFERFAPRSLPVLRQYIDVSPMEQR